MNYFYYIETTGPDKSLKSRVESAVKCEINRKNILIRKRKTACMSTAACFLLFATTAFAARSMNDNTRVSDNDVSASENKITTSTAISVSITDDVTEVSHTEQKSEPAGVTSAKNLTTEKRTKQGPSNGAGQIGKIKIKSSTDGTKSGAQKIRLDDLVYVQYCSNKYKGSWGNDNGDLVIDKSDIGEKICSLDTHSLIDYGHWDDLSAMSSSQASKCPFNNATVYKFNKCKNNTELIVKAGEDYYLFYLSDIARKVSAEEIIDVYTASNSNPIKCISFKDIASNRVTKKIKDKGAINSIVNILISCKKNKSVYDAISKGLPEDTALGMVIVLDDGTELTVNIENSFFNFSVNQRNEYGYYELSDKSYKSLLSYAK